MKGVLIGIAIFLAVILVAIGGFKLYDYIGAAEFYNNSEVVFKTPGVNDSNFVPQGMSYIPEKDTFIFTGYMGKPILGKLGEDIASRIYVRDGKGNLTFTRLLNANGTPYLGHAGGVDSFGEYIYITSEESHGIDVFSAADILSGKSETRSIGRINTYNNPAYCYIYEFEGEKYLMVGSFHKDESDYVTPEHERITTPSGDNNTSVMTVFKLNEGAELGVQPDPVAIISAREMIQGICITPDGQMVISSSWGLATSNLYFYDLSKVQSTKNYNYKGTVIYGDDEKEVKFDFTIPCYYIDSTCLVDAVKAPPMSEGLVCLDGKIIMLSESACNKYMFGKLTTGFKTRGYKYNTLE